MSANLLYLTCGRARSTAKEKPRPLRLTNKGFASGAPINRVQRQFIRFVPHYGLWISFIVVEIFGLRPWLLRRCGCVYTQQPLDY